MTGEPLFALLKGLLAPYVDHLIVKTDAPDNYYLEETLSSRKPQMFAAVQRKKSYIAFHLFPLYTTPRLKDDLSPRLRARLHGKSCFNFAHENQVPADELSELLARGFESLAG